MPQLSYHCTSLNSSPPETPLNIEAHNAILLGSAQIGMYKPTSSDHLPVVTLSQNGASESINIGRGHTFSTNIMDQNNAVIKQYDAKSGKLVSEDDMRLGYDYHREFDPNTGNPVTGIGVTDGATRTVEVDHFDRNGRIQSSDTTSPNFTIHSQYNAQGKEGSRVVVNRSGGPNGGPVIESDIDKPDGTLVVAKLYPNSTKPTEAQVWTADHRATVSFDPNTGRPNEVMLKDRTGLHSYKIDQRTGRATYDQDLKDFTDTAVPLRPANAINLDNAAPR